MKIYIINHPESTDRKAFMVEQLAKLGITDYEFVTGVDGNTLTPPNRPVGCFMAHKKVAKLISKRNLPAIVLEDDVILSGNFVNEFAERFKFLPTSFDLAFLGYNMYGNNLWNTIIKHWRTKQGNGIEHRINFSGTWGYVVNGKQAADKILTLNENSPGFPHIDMMFCESIHAGGFNAYWLCFQLCLHGNMPSTIKHGENDEKGVSTTPVSEVIKPATVVNLTPAKMKGVKISLIHPSRSRAEKAQQTFDYWLQAASGKIEIEHVLGLDVSDPELKYYKELFPTSKITVADNTCVVQATNVAVEESTGNILLYLSDDFLCPKNWDILLAERFAVTKKPLLLKVDDCLSPFEGDILTIPVMNRALYKKLGYFWHPAYRSMFCDNDLYYTGKNNGWLVSAPELKFTHEWQKNGNDEIYKKSNANWNQGLALFEQRKSANFPL